MAKEIIRKITNILCTAAILAVVGLLVYMSVFENVTVYRSRQSRDYYTVKNVEITISEDKTKPCGVVKTYQWTLDGSQSYENCLAFYAEHNNVDVFLDNQLVYSLYPDVENVITSSPGSNWIAIPIYPEDMGSVVRVVTVPVYESAKDFDIEFKIGTRYSIFLNQFMTDLPMLALSTLCIIIGAIMVVIYLHFLFKRDYHRSEILYLGLISVCLGMWRITDAKSSPWIFSGNPQVLGYITVAMLFIGSIPIILFARKYIGEEKEGIFDIAAIIASACALGAMICQLTGVAEFRQILVLSNIILLLSLAVIVVTTVVEYIQYKGKGSKMPLCFALLLALGGVADVALFYKNGNSTGMYCTMSAFLVYEVTVSIVNIKTAQQKAYVDTHTGLANKNRWDEITKEQGVVDQPTSIIMIDMNRLKYINDTMGHQTGDKIIFDFANILRTSVEPGNIICRWGGDEFSIMLSDTTREKTEECISKIKENVEKYNKSKKKFDICFAVGYAYSDGTEEITHSTLLKRADNAMYAVKRKWYADELNMKY